MDDTVDDVVTVVVIDDHEAMTRGLRVCLAEEDPLIQVVAAAECVAAAWTGPGADADVVVLDLQLAPNQPPAFGELRKLVDYDRRVIVHTATDDRPTAVRCISEIGAADFVNKAEGVHHLARAIRAVARDSSYTSPWLSGALLTDGDPNVHLARHEQEALRAWFSCGSKAMAASRMNVTQKTFDGYIQRVRAKYAAAGRRASTTTALIRRAIDDGVISYTELGAYDPQPAPDISGNR